VRIGYFSAEFHGHATLSLTAELFETHDRSRFELTAFSLGPQTRDEMRQRIEPVFDRFLEVRTQSDAEIARLARSLSLDIAVDLGGFTRGGRPGIFALRAAPVQVSYLGYLGTMSAEYMDYLIADDAIIPESHRRHYSEKIAYLPSYQANDSKRRIADRRFGREELGLPPAGFVFCCFNSTYKITPDTFDSWMRILRSVPGSVLLLLGGRESLESNLRREAGERGIDPQRIVFGARLPPPEYLARYRAADLFLDTLPYNAGTTASDALWTGLPVLTCTGETFASRIGASLLQAVGLPELITSTREQYERLAVELASHPESMASLRAKLAGDLRTKPLFDTAAFARHLEAAYARMADRYHAGLAPEHIRVDDSSV
jgi:predicted O-linked N-acetylglucosamine transferase (SPINDLY family)